MPKKRLGLSCFLRGLPLATCVLFIAANACALNADVISHVELSRIGDAWNYAVFNDEPSNSSTNWLSTFALFVNAPVTVTGSPAGWNFSTDGVSYISWFNTDLDSPFPHDVAPGTSLSGFAFSSADSVAQFGIFNVTSWDHGLNEPGPAGAGSVFVPVSIETIPEPSPRGMLALALLIFAYQHARKYRQH